MDATTAIFVLPALIAEIDILPNIQKAAEAITDVGGMTQGIEIGAGWTRKGETSGRTM